MKNFKNWVSFCFVLLTSVAFAQSKITGKVIDGDFSGGLPGASIVVKGTSDGTTSDMDGNFSLTTKATSGQLTITFIGYETKTVSFNAANGEVNVGNVTISSSDNMLEGIVITGVADVAKDRKTPVAVSTIKSAEIIEKLGAQEFPEILNSTPSVYATKSGGGFGDSRISIRGFDQKNIAVMVNGMPVNDMENSAVYWSNWAGLSDVTTAMQVQRGLGSSKLAISSVGGTINIMTKASDKKPGGTVSTSVGNNNYFKALASYSTGKLESGFSASVLLSHTMGDGYVDGTSFEGSNYYAAVGYQTKNKKHDFQVTFTGAPQSHDQRSSYISINEFQKAGNGTDPDIRYNKDWGYLDGKEFSSRRNYYHKPIGSINWDWNVNDNTKISSVFYGSWGRGGGAGMLGKINGKSITSDVFRAQDGTINWDGIKAWNSGQSVPAFGADRTSTTNDYSNGFTRRNSLNNHDWYGAVISVNKKLTERFTLDFGVDARTYKGMHYMNVSDLLGGNSFTDNSNKTNGNLTIYNQHGSDVSYNPFVKNDDSDALSFNNDGNVKWYGGFAQMEYATENLTVFLQGAVSNQAFQRLDYFSYDRNNPKAGDPNWKTDYKNIIGGNVKAGANYNIDEHHNIFGNAGYYSKQPFFNGVYLNNKNDLNPALENEKIIGVELGYGYRSEKLSGNVNLYRTSWADRILRATSNFKDPLGNTVQGTANLFGVEQIHKGVELDFTYRPTKRFNINGAFSFGDWNYGKDVTATFLDRETGEPIVNANGDIETKTLYLKDAKVGDAAQLTANLGASYEIFNNNNNALKVDGNYRYVDQLYSQIDAATMDSPTNGGAIRLPSYNLFDAGLTYTLKVGKDHLNDVKVRFNCNNVFNTVYISESMTATQVSDKTTSTWKGIDTSNQVWFGAGRTWNVTLSYNF
ncbi:MAG: carboxypeptidase-like regulatory domain-containing protein [Flavobacterium sp.]|nr:carboxypeptidase-like regulatory domain-containing protein [Candidatus Neoflavobacterium equi]